MKCTLPCKQSWWFHLNKFYKCWCDLAFSREYSIWSLCEDSSQNKKTSGWVQKSLRIYSKFCRERKWIDLDLWGKNTIQELLSFCHLNIMGGSCMWKGHNWNLLINSFTFIGGRWGGSSIYREPPCGIFWACPTGTRPWDRPRAFPMKSWGHGCREGCHLAYPAATVRRT